MIYNGNAVDLFSKVRYNTFIESDSVSKNYLLIYSEQLATNIELLCKNIKAPSNTIFQIRNSCLTQMLLMRMHLKRAEIFVAELDVC